MKKSIILKIIVLTIIIICSINSYVEASMWDDAKNFLSIGQDNAAGTNVSNMETKISELAGVLTGIGLGIGLIATAGLGVSYFLASSSEAKSEIKQKTIVVVIGLAILFASLTIWRLIVGILSSGT